MRRLTISLDTDLADQFDVLADEQGYASRSEAVRDLVRTAVDARRLASDEGQCVGTMSYVYDHDSRALAGRLLDLQHAHHGLVVSTIHVHLDHANCLESVILRGPAGAVRALAERVRAERGVLYAALNLVGVKSADRPKGGHRHDHGPVDTRE